MSANIQELLNRLSGKCDVLAQRYDLVKLQRDEARELCGQLQGQVAELEKKLDDASREIDFLRISHKIAPTADDARAAQDTLASLIKKIDKCITRLRND